MSPEPVASKDAVRSFELDVKAAVGFTFAFATVIWCVTTSVPPRLSVTVSFTA